MSTDSIRVPNVATDLPDTTADSHIAQNEKRAYALPVMQLESLCQYLAGSRFVGLAGNVCATTVTGTESAHYRFPVEHFCKQGLLTIWAVGDQNPEDPTVAEFSITDEVSTQTVTVIRGDESAQGSIPHIATVEVGPGDSTPFVAEVDITLTVTTGSVTVYSVTFDPINRVGSVAE